MLLSSSNIFFLCAKSTTRYNIKEILVFDIDNLASILIDLIKQSKLYNIRIEQTYLNKAFYLDLHFYLLLCYRL